jgi:hypothetical protein
VLINLFVPTLDTLGSGTYFGATPGLNGLWSWVNIRDNVTNQLGETGYFLGRYELYPKPLRFAQDCTVFAYRRCPQALRTKCAIESHSDTEDAATDVDVAVDAAAGDIDLVNRRVVLTLAKLLPAGPGDPVTFTLDDEGGNDVTAASAVIADSSMAPTYTFAFEDDDAGWVDLTADLEGHEEDAFTAAETKVKTA